MMVRRALSLFIGVGLVAVIAVTSCSSTDETGSRSSKRAGSDATDGTFAGDPTSEFCVLARRVFAIGVSGDLTGAGLRAEFEFLASSKGRLVAAAPDEIRSDVETFVAGAAQLGEELARVDYDRSLLDAGDTKSLTDPAYVDAGTRVQRYHDQVCAEPEASTIAPPVGESLPGDNPKGTGGP